MSIKVIKLKEFNPEHVKFSAPKQNKHGGKVVYINYDYQDGSGPKPLRIQLPRMKAPFGISGWDKDRADKKDTSPTEQSNDTLELSIGDHKELIEKFEKVDQMAIQQGISNSKDFFKKKFEASYIKMQYKSAIKFNENEDGERDDKYPPRLKTKLYKDSEFNYKMQIFNSDKQLVNVSVYNQNEVLPKGCECIALLECAGIWIINEKFGISWRPAQMKVFKSDVRLEGYSFLEDGDDQEDCEEETPEPTDDVEEEVNDDEDVAEAAKSIEETILDDEDDPLEKVEEVSEKKKTRKRRA